MDICLFASTPKFGASKWCCGMPNDILNEGKSERCQERLIHLSAETTQFGLNKYDSGAKACKKTSGEPRNCRYLKQSSPCSITATAVNNQVDTSSPKHSRGVVECTGWLAECTSAAAG